MTSDEFCMWLRGLLDGAGAALTDRQFALVKEKLAGLRSTSAPERFIAPQAPTPIPYIPTYPPTPPIAVDPAPIYPSSPLGGPIRMIDLTPKIICDGSNTILCNQAGTIQ